MKHLLTALLITLILALHAPAKGPAGAVLYFKDAQQVYLLLADDIELARGWSAFGGGAEKGESTMETAARETEEETRGYFRREWLLEKMKGQKPVKFKGFSMYFIEVPFVPALRVMQHPIQTSGLFSMHERVHYAWIPESQLRNALAKKSAKIDPLYLPASTKSHNYWNVWFDGIADAYTKNACPWLQTQ